jgi:hypothetical protein
MREISNPDDKEHYMQVFVYDVKTGEKGVEG